MATERHGVMSETNNTAVHNFGREELHRTRLLTQTLHFPGLQKVEIKLEGVSSHVKIDEVVHVPNRIRDAAGNKVGFELQVSQLLERLEQLSVQLTTNEVVAQAKLNEVGALSERSGESIGRREIVVIHQDNLQIRKSTKDIELSSVNKEVVSGEIKNFEMILQKDEFLRKSTAQIVLGQINPGNLVAGVAFDTLPLALVHVRQPAFG